MIPDQLKNPFVYYLEKNHGESLRVEQLKLVEGKQNKNRVVKFEMREEK